MLSQRGRYALKALLNIAAHDGAARQVSAIAQDEAIPRKFLEAIMSDLRRAGLVESLRGVQGGYRLARPADRISFADVVRVTDGPLAMLPCVSQTAYQRCEDCPDEKACALRHVFAEVRDAVRGLLETRTLASARNAPAPLDLGVG
jgi:Rrf2 family protein